MSFQLDETALATVKADQIADLVAVGVSRDHAALVVDLAAHATTEAMLAMQRVCRTAPNHDLFLSAMTVAGDWTRDQLLHMRVAIQTHVDALPEED